MEQLFDFLILSSVLLGELKTNNLFAVVLSLSIRVFLPFKIGLSFRCHIIFMYVVDVFRFLRADVIFLSEPFALLVLGR